MNESTFTRHVPSLRVHTHANSTHSTLSEWNSVTPLRDRFRVDLFGISIQGSPIPRSGIVLICIFDCSGAVVLVVGVYILLPSLTVGVGGTCRSVLYTEAPGVQVFVRFRCAGEGGGRGVVDSA
jgi:hypothetical protein